MPASPDLILDIIADQTITVSTIASIAEQNKRGASLPQAVANSMEMEGNIFHQLWLGNVRSDFYAVFFPTEYTRAAKTITLAERLKDGRTDFEKFAEVLSRFGRELSAVEQAESHFFDTKITQLLIEDPSGFSIVDYIAYSEEQKKQREKKPQPYYVEKIIGIGAERYKKLYCLLTDRPYIPRS